MPPENRFRYRYDTEMSGTHGSLQGIRTGREKSVPTVQLFNFSEEALIRFVYYFFLSSPFFKKHFKFFYNFISCPFFFFFRVTLVTCQEKDEPYPHPHSLFVKEKLYQKKVYENWDKKSLTKTGHYSGPHYIRLGTKKNDYTARLVTQD